ncbi:MAG: IS4 family transposase [Opitutaceae bacterium]|nr:IS4 family transposase [Opitutaceae bacterium]
MEFRDELLGKGFGLVLRQLAKGTAESIPLACQDGANARAAYRFFANECVTEHDILAGHFRATRERFTGAGGTVLVLHDTTEFSYPRENIGLLHRFRNPQRSPHPLCGIAMHSSLAVTEAGLPLGLSAVKFWTRKVFKGANELKRHVNPTRIPIGQKESVRWVENLVETTARLGEPGRCVHVGDREADIYEVFCAAHDVGTHFVIRSAYPRLAEDGTTKTDTEMQTVRLKDLHRLTVRDERGAETEAVLERRYRRMLVLAPVAKQKDYGPLELTVIHAEERGAPRGRERIKWKLLTDLPVRSRAEAIEKLQWYALRWKIEVFHKILKSGCKVELSRLRTAPRLVNLIATCCVVAWRIFWLTMINRSEPAAAPAVALTQRKRLAGDPVGEK